MPALQHQYLRRLSQPLALLLAVFSLVFLLQVTAHAHPNGVNESACRLCQVAHVAIATGVAAVVLSVPLFSFGQVILSDGPVPCNFFFSQALSRAPPELAYLCSAH